MVENDGIHSKRPLQLDICNVVVVLAPRQQQQPFQDGIERKKKCQQEEGGSGL